MVEACTVEDVAPGLELWLTSERQQMARPGASTSVLVQKAAMLRTTGMSPNSSENTGVQKARSQANQGVQLLNWYEQGVLGNASWMALAKLASRTLKVATGYAMRAGYFHPSDPPEIYYERMVDLRGPAGKKLPVLGKSVVELYRETRASEEAFESTAQVRSALEAAMTAADQADLQLRSLWQGQDDPDFSGSAEAQQEAENITMPTRGLFLAVAVGALQLQGEGFDGNGPLILEPRSSINTCGFLRPESIYALPGEGPLAVSSENLISLSGVPVDSLEALR